MLGFIGAGVTPVLTNEVGRFYAVDFSRPIPLPNIPLPKSEPQVETADYADGADKPKLGGEPGWRSPSPAPQTKPVYHP
jgi:hypothetical protein